MPICAVISKPLKTYIRQMHIKNISFTYNMCTTIFFPHTILFINLHTTEEYPDRESGRKSKYHQKHKSHSSTNMNSSYTNKTLHVYRKPFIDQAQTYTPVRQNITEFPLKRKIFDKNIPVFQMNYARHCPVTLK